MPEPLVEVLGVYALPVSKELLQEQTDILYGANLSSTARRLAERECQKQLESTVLIEALILNRDDRYRTGDFYQPRDGQTRDNCQVAWAEVYLSLDGKTRLEQPPWPNQPEDKSFRIGFFIHYWEASQPLLSTYGELTRPTVREMPERLRRLVPYELVD